MIYIVRHGETDWNVEKRIAGQTDIPLNDTGIKQAMEVAKKLKDIKFDYVFSSPLKRAYQTAKIIRNENIIIDNRLIERYNGKLEGKLKSEIENISDFNNVKDNIYEVESIESIQNRVKDFFEEIKREYPNKNILIVTHAGVGINIRYYFEGEPKNGDYSNYKIGNCEIIKYEN